MCAPGMLFAQTAPGTPHQATQQVCQLIADNPAGFQPFQFLQTAAKGEPIKNPDPILSFVVDEMGRVSNVRVRRGSGSPKMDAALVKSIKAWKFKPQPGCVIEAQVEVDIESR